MSGDVDGDILTDEEWRVRGTSFHEAGHAVAACVLLGWVDSVTIGAGSTFAGLTQWRSALETDEDVELLAGPRPVRGAGLAEYLRARALLETDVMIYLAGSIAEELSVLQARWIQLRSAAQSEAAVRRAREIRATVQRAPVPEHVREEMAAVDCRRARAIEGDRSDAAHPDAILSLDLGVSSDEAAAWRHLETLNPGRDARVLAAHAAYLRIATRELLERQWAAVEMLAGALLEHETLSGTAASLIVRRHLA